MMEHQFDESSTFAPNGSQVAIKVIDGEAVAIDVLTGKYHGMSGTACRIIEAVSQGCSLGQVLDSLGAHYPQSRERLRNDLFKFTQQLLDQSLLLPNGSGRAKPAADTIAWEEKDYHAPVLETYDDMAELLALDPPMPTVLDTPWANQAK